MRKFFGVILVCIWFFGFSFAKESYIYFHQKGCHYCEQVNEFFDENNVNSNYDIQKKEITDSENAKLLKEIIKKLKVDERVWTPFIIIKKDWEYVDSLMGKVQVIDYFKNKMKNDSDYSYDMKEDNNSGYILFFSIIGVVLLFLGIWVYNKKRK